MRAKNLSEALTFGVGAVALLGALRAALVFGALHATAGYGGKVSMIMAHAIDADVVVFGSSNAEYGVSPRVLGEKLGLTAYNLALSGTSVYQFGPLVEEFADYAKPRVIVLVLNAFMFGTIGLPAWPGLYYPHVQNPRIYETMFAYDATLTWRVRHVPLYDFVVYDHPMYRTAFQGLVSVLTGPSPDPARGFLMNGRALAPAASAPAGAAYDLAMDANAIARYASMLAYVERRGHRVVLVFPPMAAEALGSMRNLGEVTAVFASLAAGHGPFFDYHEHEMSNERRYFFDHAHLNVDGAAVFTEIMATDLRPVIAGEGM